MTETSLRTALTFTKAQPWTHEDRQILRLLNRTNCDGTTDIPLTARVLNEARIMVTNSIHQLS